MWLPVDGSDAPKIPSGKGKRLIVLHAGNREDCWGNFPVVHAMDGPFNNATVKIIKSFLSFGLLDSGGLLPFTILYTELQDMPAALHVLLIKLSGE
jgi:hypothetical protein